MEKRNEILDLGIEFSLKIIEFTELLESKRKFVIANQLMKCGTSMSKYSLKHSLQKVKMILFTN